MSPAGVGFPEMRLEPIVCRACSDSRMKLSLLIIHSAVSAFVKRDTAFFLRMFPYGCFRTYGGLAGGIIPAGGGTSFSATS